MPEIAKAPSPIDIVLNFFGCDKAEWDRLEKMDKVHLLKGIRNGSLTY